MKVLDIFGALHTRIPIQPLLQHQIKCITENCSQFLNESDGVPAFKNIEKHKVFTKLKARVKKRNDEFSQTFNEALAPKLRQRAIYAHGSPQRVHEGESTYFLFPINGYQYTYNINIIDSTIYENVYNDVQDPNLFSTLLQDNYTNVNLVEGLQSGSEILFHGIPYCYAINADSFQSYKHLLSVL